MSLNSGTKLGPYEIVAPIGAGGMGEVYKAKDTRLDRTVAIKVLPSHVASNPAVRQRFEREARAVSSLNHPHICTLYDIGSENGVDFMVMEHIEGDTLADRLKKGALPLDEALRTGIEIADALDKAHRQGVVHRDLKPGNIVLAKSGAKLLDFGLAKMASSPRRSLGEGGSALPTEAKPLTKEGSILGTFQYMAPEQLEGKEADARTDIFAFGAVLYEMVTGERAFKGKSQASLIAAILKDDPQPVSEYRPLSPPLLEHVVLRCLAKDSDERWQSAGDVKLGLEFLAETGSTESGLSSATTGPSKRGWLAAAILGALAAALAVGLVTNSLTPGPQPQPRKEFSIMLPATDAFSVDRGRIALSPSGSLLVYAARRNGIDQLFLRTMDRSEVKPIPGTEGGSAPFFSPDGSWVGFFADNALKKVAIAGGVPVILADGIGWVDGADGSWGRDGSVVYARRKGGQSGLYRVPASGGVTQSLTKPSSGERQWEPTFMPDAKTLLFTADSNTDGRDDDRVMALTLETGELHELIDGSAPRFSPTGHIVFVREASLWAIPFDAGRLDIKGVPVRVTGTVYESELGTSFDIAHDGSLVYDPTSLDRTLVSVDREGRATPLSAAPDAYFGPRISPDGKRLIVETRRMDEGAGIWVLDLERGSRVRLTLPGNSHAPIWTRDGRQVVFSHTEDMQSAPADGSVERRTILTKEGTPVRGVARSWSPDGKTLAIHEIQSENNRNIFVFSPSEDSSPKPFLVTAFNEHSPDFSPDGRWLAYVSDESGRPEVYVREYPGPGRKWSISTEGGSQPVWSPAGGELFYREGTRLMVVTMETEPDVRFSKQKVLFEVGHSANPNSPEINYTASPDGGS